MGKLFDLDNPFFRFMEHVADFFILNVLTILCSIPLITVGAALTAHHKVMQNLVLDYEQPIFKSYFRAFAGNFKQATVLWLITAAFLAMMVADVLLVYFYLDGLSIILYTLLGVISVVALGTACYTFALIARYNNTLKEHLRNGFVLAIGNLPKTVLMLLVCAAAVVLVLLALDPSFNILFLLATFGISLIVFVHTLLLKPVFLQLEQNSEEEEAEPEEEEQPL